MLADNGAAIYQSIEQFHGVIGRQVTQPNVNALKDHTIGCAANL